jgi:hypothetical protein
MSVYAKAAKSNFVALSKFSGTRSALFDLQAGTVVSATGGTTASIIPVGNGWYRVSYTDVVNVSDTNRLWKILVCDSSNFATSVVGNSVFIWGAQLEVGAFATSYIQTVASQVTRAADSASMTGTNFSSWYNQSAGTFYINAATVNTVNRGLFFASNSANTVDRIFTFGSGSSLIFAGNTAVANQFTLSQVPGSLSNASALAYQVNDFAATSNGAVASTDNSGSVPPGINQIQLGWLTNSSDQNINGTIKKLAYYPIRVTNAQLQALTS